MKGNLNKEAVHSNSIEVRMIDVGREILNVFLNLRLACV